MKRILVSFAVAFFVLSFHVSKGQVPDRIWARGGSGCLNVWSQAVTSDNNGNIYIAGSFGAPSIDFGGALFTNPDSTNDVYLVKYDSSGNQQWARSAPCTVFSWANSVATDAQGNVYVTGAFEGSITFGNTVLQLPFPTQGPAMFLAKYNASGGALWAVKAGDGVTGEASGNGCVADEGGNVAVTGTFGGAVNFGVSTLSSQENTFFIARFNPDGQNEWAAKGTVRKPGDYSNANSIAAGSGGYYITGEFSGSVFVGQDSLKSGSKGRSIMVLRYGTDGTPAWARCSSDSGAMNNSYSIAAGSSGIYITGLFNEHAISFGGINLFNSDASLLPNYDVFVVKYGPDGNVLWALNPQDIGLDMGLCVGVNPEGDALLGGVYAGDSIVFGNTVLHHANGNGFLVELDGSGNVAWATDFAVAGGGQGMAGLTADNGGNVFFTGLNGFSLFVFGQDTLRNPPGTAGVYLLKFGTKKYVSCDAKFTIEPDNLPHHYLIRNKAYGVKPIEYTWSWGDGTFDHVAYPSHIYPQSGKYKICQAIVDSNGCSTTYCDSVYLLKNSDSLIYVRVVPSDYSVIPEIGGAERLILYPNPVTDRLTITGADKSEITLYSCCGAELVRSATSSSPVILDMSRYAPGIYILRITADHFAVFKKVVKE
jgi:hypothetical protein